MSMNVLIVDDEENFRHNIVGFLEAKGYTPIEASSLAEARKHLEQNSADVILLDAQLPDGYGPTWVEETAGLAGRPPIIVITAYGEISMAVNAMKNGAHDFLEKPIQLEDLGKSIQRAAEIVAMRRELTHLRQTQHGQHNFIVGETKAMKDVVKQAQRAAAASVSVLLTGETGTGKEVLAQAIHKMGPRAEKPFIAINCAAIQNTMIESELFGHEAGAFTGADKRKSGLMEIADEGILFLDEIAFMPLDMQAKLLRAIEEKAFRRLGGTNVIKVDVQIVAASNRNLRQRIEEGAFRDDLYYRLKVVDLHLPALRERKQDIPELVGYFIREGNSKMGLNISDLTTAALEALMAHNWPGNIRELQHTIEYAMLFCDEAAIDLQHLPAELTQVAQR